MSSKKNILLLIADDLGRTAGCYGIPSVETPNIDALAASGVKFDRAFTSTASCSASRSVLFTGLHTHENGQYGLCHGWNHFSTFNHIESAPRLLNDRGYQTGIIGKVHVGPKEAYPWEVREESDTRNVAWVADRTEAFFEQAKARSRPFFLTIGYVDPHRDTATRAGFGNNEENEICDGRIKAVKYNPDRVEVPGFLSDLPETRVELAEFYQAISRLDSGVGLVLQALERQGLAESTMVVLTSDNGPPFINSKTTLYDAGIHMPLIVRGPGIQPSTVNNHMVSFIDVLPTILDWSGNPDAHSSPAGQKPRRRGLSFMPIVNEQQVWEESAWPHHAYGSHTFHEIQNYWPTRFLRSRRYKYHRNIAWRLDFPFATDLYGSLTFEGIRNSSRPVMIGDRPLKNYIFRPPEELYDLEADPNEIHNLASDPDYRSTLLDMRAKLEQWQLQTDDPWLFRDGVSLTTLKQYMEDGLKIPDRFDFDVEKPGNRDVSIWKPESAT